MPTCKKIPTKPQTTAFCSQNLVQDCRFTFSAKERDTETGLRVTSLRSVSSLWLGNWRTSSHCTRSLRRFGSRYYSSDLSIWLSVDPMAAKYPGLSPYVYCADNPVKLVDPNGEEWVDADGNVIKDHSKVKVYIFYDPNSFKKQSLKMYKDAEKKYGKGSVALSNVTTEKEFAQDWGNMASSDIREVNLNYHGSNQALHLDNGGTEYITSTGNEKTNKSGEGAKNVQDLPIPLGNISKAQLNINSCHSNSTTQRPLKGTKQTLMQAFASTFDFMSVRGTSAGVSYNLFTKQPEPQHHYELWEYIPPRLTQPHSSNNIPLYYRRGM